MDADLLLKFLAASVLLTFMPGPDILLVISESLTNGAKRGIALAAGLVSGITVHTALAASGLAVLLYQSEWAFDTVKYAGAFYLIYLSYLATKESGTKPDAERDKTVASSVDGWKMYQRGVLMNLMNPKVTLFFVAFFPQFISPNGMEPPYQMMTMGALFMVQALIIFGSLSILSEKFANLLDNSKFWLGAKWAKVVILLLLGVSLLLGS